MVAHIVMWRIASGESGKNENVKHVKELLSGLPVKIPEIQDYEIGVNSVESNRSYDVVLISRFKSWDDLETYRIHPEHVRVAEAIAQVRTQSAVVDYEY